MPIVPRSPNCFRPSTRSLCEERLVSTRNACGRGVTRRSKESLVYRGWFRVRDDVEKNAWSCLLIDWKGCNIALDFEKFLNSYKELNFMFKMLIVSSMEEEESVLVWIEERFETWHFFGIRVKFVKFIQFLWNFLLLSSVIEEFWLRGILNRGTRTQG